MNRLYNDPEYLIKSIVNNNPDAVSLNLQDYGFKGATNDPADIMAYIKELIKQGQGETVLEILKVEYLPSKASDKLKSEVEGVVSKMKFNTKLL
jgi:hypothetical protein